METGVHIQYAWRFKGLNGHRRCRLSAFKNATHIETAAFPPLRNIKSYEM
jgi:hypothetical protein